jgi:hypothetical protein
MAPDGQSRGLRRNSPYPGWRVGRPARRYRARGEEHHESTPSSTARPAADRRRHSSTVARRPSTFENHSVYQCVLRCNSVALPSALPKRRFALS